MPVCQGRATGPGQVQPCPDKRSDSTVRGRQGDLLLCDACTEFRFPTVTAQPMDRPTIVNDSDCVEVNELLCFFCNRSPPL